MLATALLLGFLVAATVTDLRVRKVFNWTTYPGLLIALFGSAATSLLQISAAFSSQNAAGLGGFIPLPDAVAGFLACGFAMLVCYVFFPGGVGGGDVKLLAMVGAFLGLHDGLEAMLWTFIFGGCQALITLIWREGAVTLLRRFFRMSWAFVRSGGITAPAAGDHAPEQGTSMFLSPSALAAVVWTLAAG